MLLVSPKVGRVVNNSLDARNLQRAEQQITDLFGSDEWRPILADRQAGVLDPERTRDELTNLMRWRIETVLGYKFTHSLRLTNLHGAPLYDMIFATDHEVGDKIMASVYRAAATRFPQMRREIRARKRDQDEMVSGAQGFWSHEELAERRAAEPARRNLQARAADASVPGGSTSVRAASPWPSWRQCRRPPVGARVHRRHAAVRPRPCHPR